MKQSVNGTSPVVVEPHDHHARHPQGDDVAGGDQAGTRDSSRGTVPRARRRSPRRVWPSPIGALLRVGPAEGAEGPQGRAEPGVQHVRILLEAQRLSSRRACASRPRRSGGRPATRSRTLWPCCASREAVCRVVAGVPSASATQTLQIFVGIVGKSVEDLLQDARHPRRPRVQTGIRWPHQSWRLMHQSRFSASQFT